MENVHADVWVKRAKDLLVDITEKNNIIDSPIECSFLSGKKIHTNALPVYHRNNLQI